MKPMIKNTLGDLWRKTELERGRIIPVSEVVAATDLNWETVSNFKDGKTKRFDQHVVARLCNFFDIEPGQPVPFLIFELKD